MPKVGDILPDLSSIGEEIGSIKGVKKVYAFGSLAQNKDNPKYRIKDIDIAVKTSFNSEDLISINQSTLSNKISFLEEEGFDVDAVKFSKAFTSINEKGIDHWAISSDNKLLHWGPIMTDKFDADELKEEAEKYASSETGLDSSKIHKASDNKVQNWYSTYKSYINKEFENMPSGWYQADNIDTKALLEQSIKL